MGYITQTNRNSIGTYVGIGLVLFLVALIAFLLSLTADREAKIRNSYVIVKREYLGHFVSTKTTQASFEYPITTIVYEKGTIVVSCTSVVATKNDRFELVHYENKIIDDSFVSLHRIGDPDSTENRIN